MKVWKYNLWKGLSTASTVGTPIITLAAQYKMFYDRPQTAISAAGIFAILIALLFFKDKIAENWKTPSPLVLSIIFFVLIQLVRRIVDPIEVVCIATMIACGADELFFKRFYKNEERKFSINDIDLNNYKQFGFVFKFTKTLAGEQNAE